MSQNLFNRYVWLADIIYRAGEYGISLDEINERWIRSDSSEGIEIPRKTFNNHRKAIQEIFDINIECRRKGGYKYYVENSSDLEREGIRRWLLDSFAVNNLISEGRELRGRIQFEHVPSGQRHLTTIIEAMRDGAVLEVEYHPYWHEPFTMTFHPYFVKVFKQRWYVIGYNPYNKAIRIYALDRIEHLRVIGEKFKIPNDFSPEDYLATCFGIEHCGDAPQRVVLKVSTSQAKFLRALPLHSSQHEESSMGHDVIFSYFLCPYTYDLKQALISLMGEAEVLEPESLRLEIASILNQMASKYK